MPTYGAWALGARFAVSATKWLTSVSSLQLVLRDAVVAHLEHEPADDGDEVGVAGALAVAVDRALHLRAARIDRHERVGDRAARIVVRVDAERRAHPRLHVGDDARDVARQHAAVGVAQHDRVGAGLGGSGAHGDRVVGVGVVAVEEVLGVEEDGAALALEVGDRVARHLDALVERRAERLGDLQVPALADDAQRLAARVEQRLQTRIVLGRRDALAPRRTERRDDRLLELEVRARSKNSMSLGLEPGKPALDVVHAEQVELRRDAQLVLDREGHALSLCAVTKGGVVESDHGVLLGGSRA